VEEFTNLPLTVEVIRMHLLEAHLNSVELQPPTSLVIRERAKVSICEQSN
jgi:hypothetical protein